ncbi:MAG TPA: sugar ABC transporter permease [Spirochaetales bacterium]|nr:sugar ABC transporter permease [Spirochaetales bacterium]
MKRINQTRRKQLLFCFYVLLPTLALYSFLRFIPIGSTIVLSFQKWNLLDAVKPFIGFNNYVKMFKSQEFIGALKNTVFFVLFTVPATVVISLALAVGLNSKKVKIVPFYQTIYFIPVVTSMVPVAVVWKWIYDPSYGLLNYFLSFFDVESKAWLIDPKSALSSIAIMSIWKVIGYYMVVFLVGIKSISPQYYEAAEIDGANGWQRFTRITLPLLKPITLFVLVISSIRAFQVFTQVYVMTVGSQGAPGNVVRVLVYEIYENGFRFFKMGYASAEAMMLFIIVAVLTLIQFRIAKEK